MAGSEEPRGRVVRGERRVGVLSLVKESLLGGPRL